MENRTEIMLTTEDGIQHLKLHGWLKRETILIKVEQIFPSQLDDFGMFILYVNHKDFTKLQEHSDLWKTIEHLGDEVNRWDAYKHLKEDNFAKRIRDFMFSFPEIRTKEDIDEFLTQTNETSLELFKNNPKFITNYIKTEELTQDEKQKDLRQMIEFFEDLERYEDCALLVKIKNKLK